MAKDKCTLYRSAETGRFVPKAYVESHPATTETEHWRISHRGERTLYRSAVKGRFVKKVYAKSHPATTEEEHRRS